MGARRRCTVAIATALVAMAIASDGRAEPAGKAEALRLFAEARKAMAAQDFVTAKEKLMASQRLLAGAGTLINLGYCQERLGFLTQAHRAYRSALVLAEQQRQKDRAAIARERLAELAKNIALVSVKIDGPEVTVAFDGEVVDVREPVPLEEGKHIVRAKTPSGGSWQGTIMAEKGGTPILVIPLGAKPPVERPSAAVTASAPSAPPPPAPAPAPAPTPSPAPSPASEATASDLPTTPDEPADEPKRPGNTQRLIGLGAMGVGVVGLGLGAFLGLRARSTYEEAGAQCNDRVCTAKGIELTDSALSSATWSTVAFGVGVAAAGAGAVLYFTAKKPNAPTAARAATIRVLALPATMMVVEAPL